MNGVIRYDNVYQRQFRAPVRTDGGRSPHTCSGGNWRRQCDDDAHDGIDAWMSKQGFSDDDYYYYIEDGVIVELMAGDDELDPCNANEHA